MQWLEQVTRKVVGDRIEIDLTARDRTHFAIVGQVPIEFFERLCVEHFTVGLERNQVVFVQVAKDLPVDRR